MSKPNKISGQLAARSIEMMESPALSRPQPVGSSLYRASKWSSLTTADRTMGKLPVTFDDFVAYGMHRTAIGPALAELESLGFIEITDQGKMARAAEYRRPKKFLLLSRPVRRRSDPISTIGRGSRPWRKLKQSHRSARNFPMKSRQYGNRTGGQYG